MSRTQPKTRARSVWEPGTSLWTHLDLMDTPANDFGQCDGYGFPLGRYLRHDGVFSARRFIGTTNGQIEQVDLEDESRGAIPLLEIEHLLRIQPFELGH